MRETRAKTVAGNLDAFQKRHSGNLEGVQSIQKRHSGNLEKVPKRHSWLHGSMSNIYGSADNIQNIGKDRSPSPAVNTRSDVQGQGHSVSEGHSNSKGQTEGQGKGQGQIMPGEDYQERSVDEGYTNKKMSRSKTETWDERFPDGNNNDTSKRMHRSKTENWDGKLSSGGGGGSGRSTPTGSKPSRHSVAAMPMGYSPETPKTHKGSTSSRGSRDGSPKRGVDSKRGSAEKAMTPSGGKTITPPSGNNENSSFSNKKDKKRDRKRDATRPQTLDIGLSPGRQDNGAKSPGKTPSEKSELIEEGSEEEDQIGKNIIFTINWCAH